MPTLNPGDGRRATLHSHARAGAYLVTHKSYRSDFSTGVHEHPVASVDFVIAGAGVTTYADDELVRQAGDLEFCPAERSHSHRVAWAGVRCMHLAFLPELCGDRLSRDEPPHKIESPRALGLAAEILRALDRSDLCAPLHIESLAHEMIDVLCDRHGSPPPRRRIDAAREFLHANLDRPVGLQELASECNLSRGRLALAFRTAFGETPGQYHRRVRLMETIRRLARTDEPVAVIALRMGFADQAHLTRTLQQEAGLTPAEFRRFLRGVAGDG